MDEFDVSSKEVEGVEEGLRAQLRHVPAPAGFSDLVMARVAEREAARLRAEATRKRQKSFFGGLHRNAGVWTSIAAALVLAVGGNVLHVRHERQERQAAQVQAQMDLAMELTGHALDQVQGNLEKSPAGQLLNSLSK